MAATGDLRDIMDLGHDGPKKPAPKKPKAPPQPRLSGMVKEVQMLMGDSVPPIPLVETPKYKSRPSYTARAFKVRQWEQRKFINGARTDNLVLRHWKHAKPTGGGRPVLAPEMNTTTDNDATNDENKDLVQPANLRYDDEFPMEKFNVKVQVPTYTNEQYEQNFKSVDWTKEETDFLMGLCRDYDLRWIVIADRYSPEEIPVPPTPTQEQSEPSPDSMEVDGAEDKNKRVPYSERTMEALKSRYYTIAAKMLETHTPANTMTSSEFSLWETMRKFDAKTETMRKTLAEKLFERTKDEAEEEKILLEELHRITKNEDEFLIQRRDLYSRLEPPPTMRRNGEEQSTAMYQTSSGLSALLQNLLAREKKFKRPSIMMAGGPDGSQSATSATPGVDGDGQPRKQKWEKGQHPNQYTRRDTMDTQNSEGGPQKKGSQSGLNVRILTPAEEVKYGISRPQERLTSGVQFRNEKANRLVAGRTQMQMQKMSAALVELGIPNRLLMPTEEVCKEFERLVTELQVLLDARKMSEKLQSEIKVLDEQRRIRLGLPKEGEDQAEGSADKMDVDEPRQVESADMQGDTSMMTNGTAEAETEDKRDEAAEDGDDGGEDETGDVEDSKMTNEESPTNADGGANEQEKEAQDEENDYEEDEEETNNEENEDEDREDDEEEEEPEVEVTTRPDRAEASASEEEEEEEEEQEEEEEEADDEPALSDLEDENADEDAEEDGVQNAADESEEEEGKREDEHEDNDEDEEEEQDEGLDANEAEQEEDDEAEAEDDAAEESDTPSVKLRPASAHSAVSRLHKRSASVISDASKAGSNRSGLGRKRKR